MYNNVTFEYLRQSLVNAENNGLRFLAQLEPHDRMNLIRFLFWCKRNIDTSINIDECMNEKIWCAIDWIDYATENYLNDSYIVTEFPY